jgi:hypothetical protein
VHLDDVVRDAYHRFDAKAPICYIKDVSWDSPARKWNGNLHGPRNPPDLECSFPKYPECETFDPSVFGRPNMGNGCSQNFTPGITTPEPEKPADYHPTVVFSAGDAMGMSDGEEYEAIDFDSWDAGALSCCCAVCRCMVDACAVYVQKAEPTPVTPVKSLGGVAAPATPLTAQKAGAVKVEGGRPVLDALLKDMGIDLQVLQNAAAGKSLSAKGLNMPEIERVLKHFKKDATGSRAELNAELSGLLASLGVQ